MRIVPNNSFLFKCKLKPSNLCDFCLMSTDSNKHMFWECNIVQPFWSEIKQLLQSRRLELISNLSYENISFCNANNANSSKEEIVINFIILLAKYFIFKCKCNSTAPSFNMFNIYLNQTIKIEETIATIKDKMEMFDNKWKYFLSHEL